MGTVSRVHTFSSGAILTAAQLNNEFDNLLTSSAINGGLDATNLGVTAGQATASKALVVDSSRNLADGTAGNRINNLALSGTFESTGAITATAGITSGGNIVSDTDSTDDLGTTGVRWRNLYVDDVTVTNNVSIGGTLTLTGGLTLNGNVAIGDSASDTLTVNSTITSNLIFTDNTYDIGASGATRPRDLHLSRNALMGGTLGVTGALTATAGITSGSDIVSDSDSTDDLGTTSVRWANLYADSIGDSGQALAVAATTLSFNAASTIDTSGNNNLTLDAGTATLTLDAGTIESDAGTLSFDGAASIDTSGNNALAINTGSANLNITAGTLALTGAQTISSTLGVSGNVTISKDAPYLIMTDSGTGGGTSKIAVDAVGSNYGLYFQADGSTNHVILESNGDFKVDADTLFVDASADSVGINSASPTSSLTVYSATNDEEVLRVGNSAGGAGDTQGITYIGITPWNSGTHAHTRIGAIEDSTGSYKGALTFDTRGAESDSEPTERMRITSAGLVKVLSDGLAINGQNSTHEANSLRIGQEGSGLAQFRAYGPDASTRGSIEFGTDTSDGNNFARAMTIVDRKLGIRTQSPSALLHTVTGNASSYTPAGNTQAIFEHTAAAGSVSRVAIIGGTSSGYSVLDFGDTSGSNNGGITYNHGDDSMSFATTNGTTKMSIQSGTEVWIANTSDQGSYNLQVGGTGVWGAGAYVNGSDQKIKQSITTYDDDATALVSQMRPVTFQYTEEYSRDRATQVGFIAQDLQQVLEGKDYAAGIVKEDANQLNVAYQSIIPILTKAVQELTQRVKELENI